MNDFVRAGIAAEAIESVVQFASMWRIPSLDGRQMMVTEALNAGSQEIVIDGVRQRYHGAGTGPVCVIQSQKSRLHYDPHPVPPSLRRGAIASTVRSYFTYLS
ncbi:MAG TPA: hypothetical protein VN831_12620 [Bradyrhizobium sp.]|nr:hypothetical protein [Bradyrhizobium sp.]